MHCINQPGQFAKPEVAVLQFQLGLRSSVSLSTCYGASCLSCCQHLTLTCWLIYVHQRYLAPALNY